jgi:glycosyltransferase involved in cell wall biosynthesis
MSLKVVAVTDKVGSAIDRITRGMSKHHTNLEYVVCDVHPKRPDPQQLDRFEREALNADIIDFQYFRTGGLLLERYPWLADKKKILTHHNPYSITEGNWNQYDTVVGNNQDIYERLGSITDAPIEYIGNSIDAEFWTFNQEWRPSNRAIMVANRIESKKGILPVAIACGDAGIHLDLVGAVSDPNYLYDVMQTGAVTFHEKISDEELRALYHNAGIYVFNSVDNYESSGQPLLEAMLTGVPVLTRRIGIVPELFNGENMVIHDGATEDVVELTNLLTDMVNDKKSLTDMRDKAWNTAKTRGHVRRAYQYQKLYRHVLNPDTKPVSIVVPVSGKPEVTRQCLDAVAKQTYKNIELIVADDGLGTENAQAVWAFAKFVNFPVRYMRTAHFLIDDHTESVYKDYGLARARNAATIEATGEIMVYCDQRMMMDPTCVEEFVANIKPRYWLFGEKGARKREFIENMSAIYRRDIIIAGMFSERCDRYGSLSQETRQRVRYQGIKTEYVETAKATPLGKSGNRSQKRQDIIASKDMLFKMYEAFDQ